MSIASRAPTTSADPPASLGAEDDATGSPRTRRTELLALASGDRLWTIVAYTAVAVGCVLRLIRFLDNPALWIDEARLAINLMDKSFFDIFGPLEFTQSAPPGFLLVEKGAEMSLGDGEHSLRLFPLLAALASVLLFAYVARRLLMPATAALAIVLFAAGEPLLERAAEVKPYSVDVAVATLLVALAVWILDAPSGRSGVRVAVLGVLGVVVVWLSFPAIFTLSAALAAIGVHAWQIRSQRLFTAATVVGGVGLASFAAVYVVASSTVQSISAAIFLGDDSESAVQQLDIVQDAWSMFVITLGFDNGTHALAALLACFGVIALLRRGSLDRLALLTVPALLAVAADLLDRYPLGGRFSLYLVPSLLVLVARGAQALVEWSRRPLLVSAGLAVFLVTSPLAVAGYHVLESPGREDIRPLLTHLIRDWREGDALYVHSGSQYALRYYTTCDDCAPSGADFPWPTRLAPAGPDHPNTPALESVPPELIIGSGDGPVVLADLSRLPQPGRLWLLFSHVLTHDGIDAENVLAAELGHEGEPVEVIRGNGARLYLFDRPAREGSR